jgi:hypothetical protein
MITEVRSDQIDKLVSLAGRLWPNESASDLRKEFLKEIALPGFQLYLAFRDDKAIGFIQIALRKDYVEGSTSTGRAGYMIIYRTRISKTGNCKKISSGC